MWCWLGLLTGVAHGGSVTNNHYGQPLRWETDRIAFRLNPSGDHGLDPNAIEMALTDAVAQWQSISPDWLELAYEGRTDVDQASIDDGVHTIFFTDEWDETLDPDLLALTYVWSYEDGMISHFDMAINTAHHTWGTDGADDSNDLCNAITHEFGHVLGLSHSGVNEATMYHETEVGEVHKRDLDVDDMRTFLALYAADIDTGGSFIGAVGCAHTQSRHSAVWVIVCACEIIKMEEV